jgi:hypothetical protein
VQNTYMMPWLGHSRSKTNSGYTDKLQMQLMIYFVAGTCTHCIHNCHICIWLDWATIQFRFYQPSSFNTALQLVLRPHFLVHFV